jgi:hypothetical protein
MPRHLTRSVLSSLLVEPLLTRAVEARGIML